MSGSDDGRLDLWEYAAAEDAALVNLHSITAHDDIITDVAVSSSAAVASSSRDCRSALFLLGCSTAEATAQEYVGAEKQTCCLCTLF